MNIIKQQGKNIAVKNINTNSNKKTTRRMEIWRKFRFISPCLIQTHRACNCKVYKHTHVEIIEKKKKHKQKKSNEFVTVFFSFLCLFSPDKFGDVLC